jgi:hypothetical protein
MKRTLFTIAMVAQLAAVGAFADTTSTTAGATTEKAGSSMASTSYGSDWSKTLGSAMFNADGTTLRSNTEMTSQYKTMSAEDKAMLQRDCMKYSEQGTANTSTDASGTATTGTAATGTADASGTTSDSTTKSTTGSTTGTTSTGATGTMNVTSEQMEQICAATKDQ